jgi:Fe-S cluster assembly protein SufD
MEEKPKVVVSRTRQSRQTDRAFSFTQSIQLGFGNHVDSYRSRALQTFNRLPIPTTSDEAWRRTDIRAMPAESFVLPEPGVQLALPLVPEELLKPLVSEQHGGQIVMAPGGVTIELDEKIKEKGVVFTDLRTAFSNHPGIVEKILGETVNMEEGKFAALAGAYAQNGALLYVPKNVTIDEPFHSVLWGPGVGLAHISHLLVWVDDGASATFVHEAASPNENGHTLHAGIVEIKVGRRANLKFVELQSWGKHVWNFSHERARV